MSNDEILTDDYVAGLLSQEAKDCSLKYSAMGMEAYNTSKKPTNMLKPNTRFLRHIIKDTDTHNKALLAKEAAESKARLKDLERSEEVKRLKTNPNARDIRRRQMGDIHAILGGKRRPRKTDGDDDNDDEDDNDDATPSSSRGSRNRESTRKTENAQDLFKCRSDDHRHRGRLSRDDDRHRKSDDRPDRHSKSRREEKRRRSRSRGSDHNEDDRRHRRRRRDRSRSHERRRRSRSPRDSKSKHRDRSPIEDAKGKSRRNAKAQANDSDPLEDLIGPAPPPKYRGRGTIGGFSGIDRRFSDSYDPKTDVQMDDDDYKGDNWDDAVEAFRDRQKLKQNQEERMRAAGFADEQIKRANATEETLMNSVQWAKAGQKKEWDQRKEDDDEL